jgi:hypothetical protein
MTRPRLPRLALVAATALLAAAPAVADPPPHAKAWGHKSRQGDAYYYDRHDDDYDDRHRHDRYCDHRDVSRHRYDYYDRYDARRLYVVPRLPYGYRYVDYRGRRYFYDRHRQWYEPYGAAFVQVASPAGLVIDSRGIAVVASVPIVRW